MRSRQSTKHDTCSATRILDMVREHRRIRITELCAALHEYSLQSIVREVNRLDEAHLVQLELSDGDYEIVCEDSHG